MEKEIKLLKEQPQHSIHHPLPTVGVVPQKDEALLLPPAPIGIKKPSTRQTNYEALFTLNASLYSSHTESSSSSYDNPETYISVLKEGLRNTTVKLKYEVKQRIHLENSVRRLEGELIQFKKRMLDLLTVLENNHPHQAALLNATTESEE